MLANLLLGYFNILEVIDGYVTYGSILYPFEDLVPTVISILITYYVSA
jgi:hypothetical protein